MKSALIRKEWHDAASSILSSDERLELYDLICSYAFTGSAPAVKHGKVAALWSLIRPALDADADKYTAKCERNRKNASRCQSLPVAATGSQSLPVAANTNTNTNFNSNSNSNSNTLSKSSDKDEKRERFDCMGIIFSRGAAEPLEECKRMWGYYESLGWKNNKGAAIVSKTSAAAMWRLQCDTVAEQQMARLWWRLFKNVAGTPFVLWDAWKGMHCDDDTLHIYMKRDSRLNEITEGEYRQQMLSLLDKLGAQRIMWHVVEGCAAV